MSQRYLSRAEAKAFYDRFGSKQDQQGWYEDAAVEALIGASNFEQAESVLEIGCGTGRLAETLLAHHLPETATYLGLDVSETMAGLTRERLSRFGGRAKVVLHDGPGAPAIAEQGFDRIVSTYVLDLLSDAEIQQTLLWAAKALSPGGLLCLAGLTRGRGLSSRIVMGLWQAVFRLSPKRVGGCRPMTLANRLHAADWVIEHKEVVVAWGIASEVVVARKAPGSLARRQAAPSGSAS